MAEKGYIEVDGLKQLQQATRRAADTDLPKRMGQAHKQVGEFIKALVDRESDPAAVGLGKGAELRPSASKREVMLRLGGSHRAGHTPEKQWGKTVVRAFQKAPDRPFVKGTVERHRKEIGDFFLKAVSEAMDPAFHKTEP